MVLYRLRVASFFKGCVLWRFPSARSSICRSQGRDGGVEGLTADIMSKCVWVRPELVAQIDFLEWTDGDHLRHSKFVGLRNDKDARLVVKEQP